MDCLSSQHLTKNNFLLWVLPYLALAFGGFIIFLKVRKNKHNRAN